ncbi:MAG: GlsB/YeaQ/YmgE family stress response membrane protein [Candidatus Dasytiphilus stammeri]
MGIISWILLGLISGILAKWFMPGRDGGGIIMTIILGILGALIGGCFSTLLGFGRIDGLNFGSFFFAIIGSILILWIYRQVKH